jgi:hypothetical protein
MRQFVARLGGLHIEMASSKLLGVLLEAADGLRQLLKQALVHKAQQMHFLQLLI